MTTLFYSSPVGDLAIVADANGLSQVTWQSRMPPLENTTEDPEAGSLLRETSRQLDAYFAGDLKQFALPLSPKGNNLQQAVFREMIAIPYGQTKTYGEIAKLTDSAPQPVGQACGANPIPIIIPCHRILSAKGLGGYSGAGGLDTKIYLLKLEGGYPFLV